MTFSETGKFFVDYNGEPIQEDPEVFRSCKQHEITIKQLLLFVHGSTEDLDIAIVKGSLRATEGINTRRIPDYLETDVFNIHGIHEYDFGDNPKEERLLHYYGDCPCWNLAAKFKSDGHGVYPCLEVHVHFRDLRAAWLKEQEDIKSLKALERKMRRKAKKSTVEVM